LAFSKTNGKELWVIALEKAYAKAYGSYWDIVGGDPVHALRDLTGAPYTRIEDFSDMDESWS
jgi:calpain-15